MLITASHICVDKKIHVIKETMKGKAVFFRPKKCNGSCEKEVFLPKEVEQHARELLKI